MQPDTIIPDLSNPQGWNRYSYVTNRPVNFNDPDGHCAPVCTAILGAIAGAVVGGLAYKFNESNSGHTGTSAEFWTAVGIGALAGGLIGSGLGAVAVGAGTGMLGSQVGYTVTAGKNYKTSAMVASSLIGGASGAFTAYVGGAKTLGATTKFAYKVGASALSGALQYETTELANGRAPSVSNTLRAAFWAAANDIVLGDMILGGKLFGNSPYAANRILGDIIDDMGRSMIVNTISNRVTDDVIPNTNKKLSGKQKILAE